MKQAVILDYYTELPENIQIAFDCIFEGQHIQEVPTNLTCADIANATDQLAYAVLRNWLNCNTPAGVTVLVQT